ncbi:nucleotidyltransferase family protein [Falsirhodobacter halotolerans]|uniref:nucleotidyltransferase family protein n=1 Tax=Falsirhodobacter halotolerans TaxID=1146892 RepID=UPI001FD1A6D0|nr:nucleotidyltransferase family protein [Falsirhodobacter halotolerans]MCJ8140168.1 nucleotidyltransferase family protein [Falsirhodobacter halotolerans]
MILGAVLLAAGASRRFGAEDKLLTPVRGVPMVCHAARLVARFPKRLAVVSSDAVRPVIEAEGVSTHRIPAGGQGDSLAAAVSRLGAVDRLAVFLGDMPDLTAGDVDRLLATDPSRPACAVLDGVMMPPVIFPRAWLSDLTALTGDRGAGALLRAASPTLVSLPPSRLHDVDRPEDLKAIQSDGAFVSPS